MKRAFGLLAVWCVTVILPGSAFAQADTAHIIGTVRDAQGGAIADVAIAVLNIDTGFLRRATTDSDGRYRVTALPPGRYSLTADRQGFRTVVRDGLILLLGAEPIIDIELPVGGLSESLLVTADVPIVNTTTSAIESATLLEPNAIASKQSPLTPDAGCHDTAISPPRICGRLAGSSLRWIRRASSSARASSASV